MRGSSSSVGFAVWRASGHVSQFTDPLTQCSECKRRFRVDKLLEEHGVAGNWDAASLDDMTKALRSHAIACPECGAEHSLGDAREFNLLFETRVGAVQDDASIAYLRPETAQGALVQGPAVLSRMRSRLPAGIAQVGRSFRNEIAPGHSLFRTREFEQAEIQVFSHPKDAERVHSEWTDLCHEWLLLKVGLDPAKLRRRVHTAEELAHYSKGTTDLEFLYPFGWGELWGISNRGDYDLRCHERGSGQDTRYRDPQTQNQEAFHPFVIEPALGVNRLVLAVLSDALVSEGHEQAPRLVMRLPTALAPFKASVLPLMKKDGMTELSHELRKLLVANGSGPVSSDVAGSIGKRYRRQDEIGTPVCITVDYQTLDDGSVTVRCRDTMAQTRVSQQELLGCIGPLGLDRGRMDGLFL
jgi:glycyl-tRNA synthetase